MNNNPYSSSTYHYSQNCYDDYCAISEYEQVKIESEYRATLEETTQIIERVKGKDLPFMLEQVDGVFALLLMFFVFSAYIYNGGIGFLRDNFKQLFSSSNMGERDFSSTTRDSAFSYFLAFQFIFLISIVIYEFFMDYTDFAQPAHSTMLTLALFSCLFIIYLLVKIILYRLIGFIFNLGYEMKISMRSYLVIFEILGVLYFFPTLFLIYSNIGHVYLIAAMVILFILAHLVYFYERLRYFSIEKFNFLYLIAYLCTIEILPCLLLGAGLVYIYKFDVLNLLWLIK